MNVKKVVTIAVWCFVVFFLGSVWPIQTMTVVAIILIAWKGKETTSVAGNVVSNTWLIVTFLAAFYVVQIVMNAVFGIEFATLYDDVGERSVLGPLLDMSYMGPAFGYQLASIIFSAVIAWKYAKSANRGTYQTWAAIVCLACLCYWSYTAYAPVDQKQQASRRNSVTLVRTSAWQLVDSGLLKFGINLNRDADMTILSASVPKSIVIKKEVPMFEKTEGKDAVVFAPSGVAQIDDKWFIRTNVTYPVVNLDEAVYVEVVSDRDTNIVRYLRSDHLDELQSLISPPKAKPATEARLAVNTRDERTTVLQSVKLDRPLNPQEDVVCVNSTEWTNSVVWTGDGDVIEIWSADGGLLPKADLESLLICSGDAPIAKIGVNQPDKDVDAVYGRVAFYGGNSLRATLRLKSTKKGETVVKIVKQEAGQ